MSEEAQQGPKRTRFRYTSEITQILFLTVALVWIGWQIEGLYSSSKASDTPVTSVVGAYKDQSMQVVYIRGDRWTIWFGYTDDALDKLKDYGLTDCPAKSIYVLSDLGYMVQRDVVLHELYHAGTCGPNEVHNLYWNSKNEEDHTGIYRLSEFTIELLHTNPELTRYLAGQ